MSSFSPVTSGGGGLPSGFCFSGGWIIPCPPGTGTVPEEKPAPVSFGPLNLTVDASLADEMNSGRLPFTGPAVDVPVVLVPNPIQNRQDLAPLLSDAAANMKSRTDIVMGKGETVPESEPCRCRLVAVLVLAAVAVVALWKLSR